MSIAVCRPERGRLSALGSEKPERGEFRIAGFRDYADKGLYRTAVPGCGRVRARWWIGRPTGRRGTVMSRPGQADSIDEVEQAEAEAAIAGDTKRHRRATGMQ